VFTEVMATLSRQERAKIAVPRLRQIRAGTLSPRGSQPHWDIETPLNMGAPGYSGRYSGSMSNQMGTSGRNSPIRDTERKHFYVTVAVWSHR
jgi:hypothetical protein